MENESKNQGVDKALALLQNSQLLGDAKLRVIVKAGTAIIAAQMRKDREKSEKYALSALYQMLKIPNEKLQQTAIGSIYQTIIDSIDLDMPIDGRGRAWAIVRKNKEKKVFEMTCQLGYKAYVFRFKKLHPEGFLDVNLIWEDDDFSYSKQNGEVKYTYTPKNPFRSDFDKIKGGFVYMRWYDKFNNKCENLIPMSKKELEKIKEKSLSPVFTPEGWLGEMWKKCVLRRGLKVEFEGEFEDLDEHDNKSYEFEKKPESPQIEYGDTAKMPEPIEPEIINEASKEFV
jgi:hypothetical protein